MRNGLVETFYDNGNIQYRINYKDDKYHGLYESFYKNRNIEYRIIFKDGKYDGLFECFKEDGSLLEWKYFKSNIEVTDKYIRLENGEVIPKAEWREREIDSIIND